MYGIAHICTIAILRKLQILVYKLSSCKGGIIILLATSMLIELEIMLPYYTQWIRFCQTKNGSL